MKEETAKRLAKGLKSVLALVLQTEANTASSILIYQPKAPKELRKYRKNKC